MPSSPEADPRFSEFIILQAQNAGLFLGQIPNPHTGRKQLNLRAAKSVLDCLNMLVPKTRGNLTPQEHKLLQLAIANLTSLYEKAGSDAAEAADMGNG
jgi:hypothetical protein